MQSTETSDSDGDGNIQWDPDGTADDFYNDWHDPYVHGIVNLSVFSEDNFTLRDAAVVHNFLRLDLSFSLILKQFLEIE